MEPELQEFLPPLEAQHGAGPSEKPQQQPQQGMGVGARYEYSPAAGTAYRRVCPMLYRTVRGCQRESAYKQMKSDF